MRIKIQNLQFQPINEEAMRDIASFSSGNSTIDSFLKEMAYYLHIKRDASTTLIYNLDKKLIAYFTLTRTRTDIKTADVVNDEHLFALNIARLAVAKPFQSNGIGSTIISYIMNLAICTNERFIVTDALFEKWKWYQTLGFNYIFEKDIHLDTTKGMVYMFYDLYDSQIMEDYFDE